MTPELQARNQESQSHAYRAPITSGQASFKVIDVVTDDQATTIFEPQFDRCADKANFAKSGDVQDQLRGSEATQHK